ncbi:MAG TPA: SDR family oxidoreductase, partial [Rhodopila sp.]
MPAERKTAIVTGAASGMGRAMALGLSEAGFDVVAVDRNAGALETLPASIKPLAADLAQPDSFEKIVSETLNAFGRIDILVNNAGIGQAGIRADQRSNPIRFWEVTPEQWNRFQTVNATAPIMMSLAVLPHMLKANSGRIVTVTTSLGTMVREGYLLYGSSKASAESAMAVLAADLKGTGITSNVLVPG